MKAKSLSTRSAWPASEVTDFFEAYRGPLRLAVVDSSGFPMICSLWYRFDHGRIFCATTKGSRVVECLRENPKCGFELAPNEPPYFGVRGRGLAKTGPEGAMELLETLVDRYLGSRETKFAKWLLSRRDEEVVIGIDIQWMTSWDFRSRMSD
jgi:nitroimidazol reductase NimA-like FMN-containing flavoprotein (pyridoxamine 5'-phosphate oxidase superfamily)